MAIRTKTKQQRSPDVPLSEKPRISEKAQAKLDARRAEINERYQRVVNDCSPCCNVKAPKHDRMRGVLVACTCGKKWTTIPGV